MQSLHKSYIIAIGWGFAPDPNPTAGGYSAPPDPLAVFARPAFKGRGGNVLEFVLCPRKTKENSMPML